LTPPRWVRSKSSPIALENILYYLTQLAQLPITESQILDAGGPEYISYQELFKRFIKVSGKRRLLIPIPIPVSMISVHFISLITSVPPSIAKELIQGLQHDLPADDKAIRELIPQTLIS
ncbi:NAD(P)-dependent oxidoreductase, partial [Bacillus subtilis]